ncbi:MAG: putative Zn-dependent protease [Cyclobacteriaceae bacterium]|jgi:predicted Zn-dependent protease
MAREFMKMKILKHIIMLSLIAVLGFAQSCGEKSAADLLKELIFPVQEDVTLGLQVSQQIANSPDEFPILDPAVYAESYTYLNAMKNAILQSGAVQYEDIFPYELKIIQRDDVLNAFATPGGYIYVYTGLIKYLEKADDLAGVMGHEIAHSDRRHSVNQMIKNVGVQTLLSIVAGEGSSAQLAEVIGGFLGLKFSRSDESEADEYSVIYLSETDYACNGAARFFELIEAQGGAGGPEFLSTHPSPANRVVDINAKATEEGCDTTPIEESMFSYEDFVNSLP